MNYPHLKTNVHVLFNLWFVFCHAVLFISMHCGFLGGKLSELSTFENKCPCLVHFVVCLCHALLLISMHCGFLAGEFSELSTF